jgi:hypothetical protein
MIPSKEVASQHSSSQTADLAPRWLLFIAYNFLLFWLFLFRRDWGIGLTLFEIGHLLPSILTTKTKSPFFFAKAILAVLISTFFWSRDFDLIQAMSLVSVLGLNFMLYQEAESGELITPAYLLRAPFIWLSKLLYYSSEIWKSATQWRGSFKGIGKAVDNQNAKRVIVGVLISLPVLALFVILFSSADENFQALTNHIIEKIVHLIDFSWLKNLSWLQDWFVQFLCFWVYLCFVLPYPWKFTKTKKTFTEHLIEKTTMGGLVGAIFAVFIATQFKSFSAILNGFKTGQLNPALYVREGFAQLLIACVVGIGVFVFLKNDVVREFISKLKRTAFAIAAALLAEIFLVSLVAGERVWLYQYQYGLTRIRIFGILFLLFLFSVISILLADLLKKVRWHTKWQLYILSAVMVVFLAGFMNMDSYIVNTRPPVVNGKVDVEHIAKTMSYDASDFWLNNLKDVKAGNLGNCTVERKNGQLVLPSGFNSFNDLKTACQSTVEQYKKAYELISFLPQFMVNAEKPFGQINWDESELPGKDQNFNEIAQNNCKKVNDKTPWLSGNRSQIENRQALCEKYDSWMQFKEQYEILREAASQSHSPIKIKVLNVVIQPNESLAFNANWQAQRLIDDMKDATKFKGTGESALNYEIAETMTVNRQPTMYGPIIDKDALVREIPSICQKFNEGKIDEVWLWAGPQYTRGGFTIIGENIMGNSGSLDLGNFPKLCGKKTLTMMEFDATADTTSNLQVMAERVSFIAFTIAEDESHRWEYNAWSLKQVDWVPARSMSNGQLITACGTFTMPPNNTYEGPDAYSYNSNRKAPSDCDDWNYNRSGEYKEISCTAWGCSRDGYLKWWMQHLPGLNNKIIGKDGKEMPNWWYAIGRYDEYVKMINNGEPYAMG